MTDFLELHRTIEARMVESHDTLLRLYVAGLKPANGRGFWPQIPPEMDDKRSEIIRTVGKAIEGEAMVTPEFMRKMMQRVREGTSALLGGDELKPEAIARMEECLTWPAYVEKEKNRVALNKWAYCKARSLSFSAMMRGQGVARNTATARKDKAVSDIMRYLCGKGIVPDRAGETFYCTDRRV
ncbi:DUF6362 family protein [Pseudovibrio sp. SPO723]|uniref:DUF6362 family protein n=1 Tax=Nesiotobacter zosterae TaxID=392721 RepID=UPI0029C148F8|nr:DUF6362 family protein [Pseudovibrio sp. SPO723]MDX5592555.1 DUF6362 family protein [Pseudovibrio sp. SPO723]